MAVCYASLSPRQGYLVWNRWQESLTGHLNWASVYRVSGFTLIPNLRCSPVVKVVKGSVLNIDTIGSSASRLGFRRCRTDRITVSMFRTGPFPRVSMHFLFLDREAPALLRRLKLNSLLICSWPAEAIVPSRTRTPLRHRG